LGDRRPHQRRLSRRGHAEGPRWQRVHRSGLVAAWGKGIAREAAARLIAYGFDNVGLGAIVGITHPENAASQRVLGACGLARVGAGNFYGQIGLPMFALSGEAFRRVQPIAV
jgi:RimJ/RimL family protein N-acetyltransferase